VPAALERIGRQLHPPGPGTGEHRVPVDRRTADVQLSEPHEGAFQPVAVRWLRSIYHPRYQLTPGQPVQSAPEGIRVPPHDDGPVFQRRPRRHQRIADVDDIDVTAGLQVGKQPCRLRT
jgi:hypothetical protein